MGFWTPDMMMTVPSRAWAVAENRPSREAGTHCSAWVGEASWGHGYVERGKALQAEGKVWAESWDLAAAQGALSTPRMALVARAERTIILHYFINTHLD